MPKKILFFLDLFTLHFGIANFLQNNTDYELYALIDTTDKPKNFFKTQQIVNFKKTWYYHDYVNSEKNNESDYLEIFGKKYDLNITQLIKNDRFFSHFNNFYNFSSDEINSILINEAKLFEKIISDCKPDFLVMFQPSLRHEFVFYEVCKKNNVIPLIINPSLMGYRTFISDKINILDQIHLDTEISTNKSFEDLQILYKNNNINQQINDYVENYANSKYSLMKSGMEFLFNSNNSNVKTHYTYFGRTKLKVLNDTIKSKLKKKTRYTFIKKNLQTTIPSKNFIYFPLQVEPDRNLLLGAPNFTNQITSITNIAKSLPPNYILCVKEHPGQNREWRDISFYEKISQIPNVVLLSPTVPSFEIYEKCSMVITAAGTSGFEALFYGKPVIVFAQTLYSILPSVQIMNSFENLETLIKNGLDMSILPDSLEKFLSSLEKNSFDFDLFGYYTMQAHHFFYDSNLIDVDIASKQMINFLEKNSKLFNLIGNEILYKIND